jgi:hypothetical protein
MLVQTENQSSSGGERGIRTLAPLTQSNPLAEGPLIATWVSLQAKYSKLLPEN